jgi:nicotinate phosphoribosyltransferase
VDGFGVGTAVAYPPVIDLSAKIVEVQDGQRREFRAKRGGMGGRKAVYRSPGFRDFVALEGKNSPKSSTPLLHPLLKSGKPVRDFDSIETIRSRVTARLNDVKTAQPTLAWR